ncbi:MAG: HlyC/CorC family transporter [Chloroflexi bacterium]|nr:HlyC/CorC family transporter [Chloroflexota bacterium]
MTVTTRRRRPGLVAMLGYAPSPGLGAVRVLSAGIAGVSLGVVVFDTDSALPSALLLLIAAGSTAVALITIQVLADRLSSLYPDLARRVARPRQWFSGQRTPTASEYFSPNGRESGPSTGSQLGAPEAEGHPRVDLDALTADEILNLDQYDIDMVRSISHMDDRDVQDIMVPRLDMDAVALASSLDEVVKAFVSTRHTRLPVYRNTMDDVVGIVHISDVLPILASGETATTLNDLMREPEFVAENMALDDLLQLMRAKSLQMAVVVDEYGGVEGLVTLEDVLEEIVGEIEDEFTDEDPEEAARAEDGSWILNASVPLEEVSRIVGVQLNGHDVNTIGGYVYTELGRMPAAGDVIAKDDLHIEIEVVQVRGRRIQQVRLSWSGACEESGS